MTMIDKNDLKKAFEKILRDADFVKKSGSWYRSGPDAIVVLNLQKSDFGDYFYLNVGICLKALSDDPFLKINKCHITMRADGLVGNAFDLDMGLNLAEGRPEDLMVSLGIIENDVLPILSDFLSLNGLRAHYKRETFKKALLFWQAKDVLEKQN